MFADSVPMSDIGRTELLGRVSFGVVRQIPLTSFLAPDARRAAVEVPAPAAAFFALIAALQHIIGLDAAPRWTNISAGYLGRPLMPQPRHNTPDAPPIGLRRCPKCGLPMFLASVEPAEKPGEDKRTFECGTCATVIVQFR